MLKRAALGFVIFVLTAMLLLVGQVSPTSLQNYSGNHCLSFDGIDDYVSRSSSVYQTEELTIELWLKPEYTIENGSDSNYGHMYGAIISYSETWASQGGWALYFNFSDGRLCFTYRWCGPYQGCNTKTFYTNRAFWNSSGWYHVAVTYSPTKYSLAFYVNASEDRTYTWGNEQHINYESASLKIGGDLSRGYMFQGLIDEVRVWNVSRTHSEIIGSWNRALNLTECENPTLIGYWRFDEGAGLESQDLSLQGNNATLGLPPFNPTWSDLGAPIIPEFSSFLILQLFMITTLLAVIVYRRKRFKIAVG
jgi:hypothetical protein